MNGKRLGLVVGITLTAAFVLNGMLTALACGGGPALIGFDDPAAPKSIVLAAFAYLGPKVKTAIDPTVTPWQWNENIFANSSLECPSANRKVDQTLTDGYQITISVPTTLSFTDYFFVAAKDGKVLFECTSAGPGPRIAVKA